MLFLLVFTDLVRKVASVGEKEWKGVCAEAGAIHLASQDLCLVEAQSIVPEVLTYHMCYCWKLTLLSTSQCCALIPNWQVRRQGL